MSKEKINLLELNRATRERFIAGELTSQQVIEMMGDLTNNYKSWQSSYWKENRKELIGDHCVQCGTKEGVLVLQHFYHPVRFMNYFNSIRSAAYHKWEQSKHFESIPNIDVFVERDGCPKCHSVAIRYRKSTSEWVCHGKKKQRECGNVFSSPMRVTVIDQHATSDLKKEKRKERYDQFLTEWDQEKDKRTAILMWFDGNIRYLSFVDTTTFCKKCAFLWDMKDMCYCHSCGKWHNKFRDCPYCAKRSRFQEIFSY